MLQSEGSGEAMANPDYDVRKLKQLVLYVARRCEGQARFGRTKLNKMLFSADFAAYRELGRPIVGATYLRFKDGPVARQLRAVAAEMELEGDYTERAIQVGRSTERRPIALSVPDMTGFSADEIRLIDAAIQELAPMTAAEASAWSHRHPGWKYTDDGQEIPYYMALAATETPELTPDELAYGLKILHGA